jgi:RNA polymerase primary sigma factor
MLRNGNSYLPEKFSDADMDTGVELDPDALFDPIWKEETVSDIPVMTEWDKEYQRRIESYSIPKDFLTADEERQLAADIAAGKAASIALRSPRTDDPVEKYVLERAERDGKTARDELITKSLRLASWFVRCTMDLDKNQRLAKGKGPHRGRLVEELGNLSGGELDYSDRMQIASLGLIEAASKFDASTRFTTYAMICMERRLLRTVYDRQAPLHIPEYISVALSSLNKVVKEFEDRGVLEPDYSQLADRLGLPPQEVIKLYRLRIGLQNLSYEVLAEHVSAKAHEQTYDAGYDPEDETAASLSDILPHGGTDRSVEEEADDYFLGRTLDEALAKLNEREQRIIEMWFGLEEPSMTLEKIGIEFDVTRERIRQIFWRAVKKILKGPKGQQLTGINRAGLGSTNEAQGGERPEYVLDEADMITLGISKARPYAGSSHCPVQEVEPGTPRKQKYTLEEFTKLRQASNSE